MSGDGPGRSTLAVAPEQRSRLSSAGDRFRPGTKVLSLVVDGTAMEERVARRGFITLLSPVPSSDGYGDAYGERLLGLAPAPDLAAGRIPLLVCGRCADLACGQLTARLTLTEGEVAWSEVRWEDSREETEVDERLGEATFRFERSGYEAAVRGAALAVADLPTWQPPPRRSWWRRG